MNVALQWDDDGLKGFEGRRRTDTFIHWTVKIHSTHEISTLMHFQLGSDVLNDDDDEKK